MMPDTSSPQTGYSADGRATGAPTHERELNSAWCHVDRIGMLAPEVTGSTRIIGSHRLSGRPMEVADQRISASQAGL
jgi:hypothetical protein